MSCPMTLLLASLRQDLSLNLELGWWGVWRLFSFSFFLLVNLTQERDKKEETQLRKRPNQIGHWGIVLIDD